MTNLEKYKAVFTEIFDVSESSLNEDFTFKAVEDWDSLTHLSLITQLEDTFDVMFDTEDILHYESFENGKRILRKYGIDI